MEAPHKQVPLNAWAKLRIGETLRAMYGALEEDVPERLIRVVDGYPVDSAKRD